MNKPTLLFLLAVGLVGALSHTADPTSDKSRAAVERAVIDRYDQMVAAAESLNVDELYRYVADTDQGALVLNGRLIRTRAEALANTRNSFNGIKAVKYQVRDRLVTVLSPTSALLVTTGTSNVETEDGRTFSRPFAHSVVFVFQDGAWRVVHSHQSTPPSA